MEEFIPLSQIGELLDACAVRRARVLGAEGFHVVGQLRTPEMNSILDLSSVIDPAESVAEARRFFEAVTNRQLRWVVVTDRDT